MKPNLKQILQKISESEAVLDSQYFKSVTKEADEFDSIKIGNAICEKNKELEQRGASSSS